MSNEQDWLDYAQKLGPSLGAIASSFAAGVAVWVASQSRRNRVRDQANKITGWIESAGETESNVPEPDVRVNIRNASDLAAYDLVIRLVRIPNRQRFAVLEDTEVFGIRYVLTLPPGQRTISFAEPGSGMHRRFGVDFAFQDADGLFWYRNSAGQLYRVSKHPVDYFGVSWPVGWGS